MGSQLTYQRHCPECKKQMIYRWKSARDRANRENLRCKNCILSGKKEKKDKIKTDVIYDPGKRFIYFPSFSSKHSVLKKDDFEIGDLKTIRFYADNFPEKFRHKFFLLTAGEFLYKKSNIRQELGLEDSFVFGDSGGFQIASGALEWSEEIKDKIFEFLIANADLAMNLDIPPKLKYFGYFEKCLDISYENFKYFEKRIENENPSTKFLNVLQLDVSEDSYDVWYNKMKDFHFKGWGVGGTLKQHYNALYVLALFLKNREFEKKHNEYIHFLGTTSPFNFLIYAVIQKNFNKLYPHLTVTTDSSTPLLQPVFGNWAHSINWKLLNFNYLKTGSKNRKYNIHSKLPCVLENCPICSNITYNDLTNYNTNTEYTIYAGWHNLFILVKAVDWTCDLVYGGNDVLENFFPPNIVKLIKSIDEMFQKPEDAMKIFFKYKNLYKELSNAMDKGANKTLIDKNNLFSIDEDTSSSDLILNEEELLQSYEDEEEIDNEEVLDIK